jgi:hypothetical protein
MRWDIGYCDLCTAGRDMFPMEIGKGQAGNQDLEHTHSFIEDLTMKRIRRGLEESSSKYL